MDRRFSYTRRQSTSDGELLHHMSIIASELLTEAAVRHGIQLEVLVAETGLWANPEVHLRVARAPGGPPFFPNRRRYRAGQGEARGQKIGCVVLDDNSYANIAIKRAIGVPRSEVIGFEACHIWPLTCYDEQCHTVIANLVLLPRALAGLTDHSPAVQAALQFRAWELYGWHPQGKPQPSRPDSYPSEWRPPMPFNDLATAAVSKRALSGFSASEMREQPSLAAASRDYTRYDVTLPNGEVRRNLPKRLAMLVMVRALVASDVIPALIASALPSLRNRLFCSAAGQLNSQGFVAAVAADRQRQGKAFDSSRYFCADGELLQVGGRTYALTNQWGGWTADTISTLLESFPQVGVSVRNSNHR